LVKNKQPFYEENYQEENHEAYPVLKIICSFQNMDIPFTALADTGCDSGVALSKYDVEILKRQFKDFRLGEKINEEPIPIGVADGRIVGADVYYVKVKLGNITKDVTLLVTDPERIIGYQKERKKEIDDIFPLVGRDFLNHFDVLFKGKKRKISVFI